MELLETIVKRKHSTKAARDRRSICFLSCFPFATTETAAQPKPSPTKAPAIKPVMPGGRKKSKNNKKKKKGKGKK